MPKETEIQTVQFVDNQGENRFSEHQVRLASNVNVARTKVNIGFRGKFRGETSHRNTVVALRAD